MQKVSDIRQHFINELKNENFTVDRNGSKTIEMLGASFLADETAIFGKPNKIYIEKEIAWYEMQSANVKDISENIPAAWIASANKHGEINSNYGMLIYGDRYYNQFDRVVNELNNNPNSRRAEMIYTRPSVWVEAFENGKNDFICTNTVTYYIRDNKLHCVVQMRSNDVVFGYKNDYAWQYYLLRKVQKTLNKDYELGDIIWQVQNLHVYERHFELVQ